ncbi:MAG: (2Fe-2S)-binding protein, partial [Firmicutes bacterium]|nr:(2Fe-2S)-binding protein [Bacillota bacterium]
MVKLTIDNLPVKVKEGTTILKAAETVGIHIPTLCYLEGINEIGACRVCIVEIEGKQQLEASCNTAVEEGMVVYTNSPRVRKSRRTVVELILSQHDCLCATCVRSGNCELQTVANDLGILKQTYKREVKEADWPKSFPLVRDMAKCIKCMRCVQICDKVQDMHIWDVEGTGSRTNIDVSHNRSIKESDCTICGQCITHCPTGALRERDDTDKVLEALADPNKITVIQVAPAVRTAWAEYWHLDKKKATPGRMVAAIRKLGFDYVFDTNFSADLTIMEEGSELLARLAKRGVYKFPMFTSCCPGWVRFLKSQYPDMTGQLSTAKSPQQMFGAVAKSYFAEKIGVDPRNIFCVSVMPCTAKKHECAIPGMNDACGDPDVDISLTTRELVRLIRADHITPDELKEDQFDSPLGSGTGAAVIFGTTGGVMEAALRSAVYLATGENPSPDAFPEMRGMDGWKEATYEVAGKPLRCAVVSGLGNTRKIVEAIRRGEVEYE